jgi:hypothetical protein
VQQLPHDPVVEPGNVSYEAKLVGIGGIIRKQQDLGKDPAASEMGYFVRWPERRDDNGKEEEPQSKIAQQNEHRPSEKPARQVLPLRYGHHLDNSPERICPFSGKWTKHPDVLVQFQSETST